MWAGSPTSTAPLLGPTYERVKQRGHNLSLLASVIGMLLREETLDQKYRDHALTGKYIGFRECHTQPDWLLIYIVSESEPILTASR